MSTSPHGRTMGARDLEISAAIFGQDVVFGSSGFHGSERHGAVNDALAELHDTGVVEKPGNRWWRLGQAGEEALADQVALWTGLAQIELTDERRQLLEVVNRRSEHQEDDCAWLDWVEQADFFPDLDWPDGPASMSLVHDVASELKDRGLVARHPALGAGERLHATYRGLVWSTRRQATTPRLWTSPFQASPRGVSNLPPLTLRQQRLLYSLVVGPVRSQTGGTWRTFRSIRPRSSQDMTMSRLSGRTSIRWPPRATSISASRWPVESCSFR